MTARTVGQIAALEPQRWDCLAGPHGVTLSHAFLTRIEETPSVSARYLTIEGGDGALLGALPLYLRSGRDGVSADYDPWQQLGAGLGLGAGAEDWLPMAYAGGRSNEAAALLLAPELDAAARAVVARRLAARLEEEVRASGARASGFFYARPDVVATLLAALPAASAVAVLAQADMEIPIVWPELERYIAAQSKSRRNSIRRDLRAFAAAGYATEVLPLAAVAAEAAELVCSVEDRRGDHVEVARIAERFATLARRHGDDALAIVGTHGGRPVAVVVALVFAGRLHAWAWGCDPAHVGQPGVYGAVGYYAPVRYAIEHGLTSVGLGAGAGRAKALRGAVPVPLYHVLLTAPGLDGLAAGAVERLHEARRAALEAEMADIVGSLTGPEWLLVRGGAA